MPLHPPEKQQEDTPPPPLEGVGTVDSSDHGDDGVSQPSSPRSARSFGASATGVGGGGGASPMPGLPTAPPSVVNRVMETVFLDNGVEVEGANTLRNMALVALALGISGAEPEDSPLRIISDEVAQEPRVAKALRLVQESEANRSATTPSVSRAASVHSSQQASSAGGSMTSCGDVIAALDATAAQDGYFEAMSRFVAARRAKDTEIRAAAEHAADAAREQELTDAMKRSVSNVFVPSSRRKSARAPARSTRAASSGSRRQSGSSATAGGAATPSSAGGATPGRKQNRASGYWGPIGKGPGDDSIESAPGGLGFSSGRRQTKNALRDLAKSVIARQLPDYMPVTCGHCKVSNAAPAASTVRPVGAPDTSEASMSGAQSRSMRGMMAELAGGVSTSAAAARAANGPGGALPHSTRGPDVVYPVALGLTDEDSVEGRLWRLLASAQWPDFDPESAVDRQPLTKQRKAALLASHYQSRIGVPPWAEYFYKKKREEADAVRRQVAYQQASSRRLAEFQSRSAATKLEITALEKALSVRDPVEHAAQVEVALSALQKDLDQLEQLNLTQETELASHRKYGARYKERITLELEEMRRCLRFLGRLHDIARDGSNQAHIPATVMAKDAIAELILPILERYPGLAMTGQHDLEDDDGGELDFDPLGHQCPDCLLLKSSSPFCTVSGRKHQESMPVDARPLDQAEQDRIAMDQSRADYDALGVGGGEGDAAVERRRKRRRRRQRQQKRAARKRSSAAARADGGGGSASDVASGDDDAESSSGTSTTSASTASHVSDTTTDAGADSDASSETWDRRDHRRRRRQRLLRNILARGRKDTAVPADGAEASTLQAANKSGTTAKPGGKKSKKLKSVVPGLAGVVGAVMGAKAKVRSRYLDPPGARRNAGQAGRRDGGDEGGGPSGANTIEQIMTGLESVLVDAFGSDVLLNDPSASSSSKPHHPGGASEKQHSQHHSKRGSTSVSPRSGGGKHSQPLSAVTSPQRSPRTEHLSLPAHATTAVVGQGSDAHVEPFPNTNNTSGDSEGAAKKAATDDTPAIPAVKTPPEYQAPGGEESAARHCREFMDAVAARNVGVMRTIANRGMDESAMNPSTSAAVFRHQLHEQEAQFCEWFSLMLLRTQDAKVAANKLKMKNEISAATTVAQSEAEIRSLRKELRNLNYSFDKRPKGRSAGASLDDSAFKGLVGRIGELEKRHLHLRTRIKYAVSERHIIENKHAGLVKPAPGASSVGGDHSGHQQQSPQGAPQGQMGNSSRNVTSPLSHDGAS